MTGRAADRHTRVDYALFAHADHGKLLLHAECGRLHDCAALIQYEPGCDFALAQPLHDRRRRIAAGLLVVGKRKVHVTARLKTCLKQFLAGFQKRSQDTLGVHRAPSIKVAEAAKVIENSQRDINIAFMNELSIIFNKMGIDTRSVLEAAGTKWNFLRFSPGLVGGHCIGVDPYYLTYKAEMMGYHSQMILSGRRINDDMGKYVAENCVKTLIRAEKQVKGARIAILGFTFKENWPDTRNSKVFDIVRELHEYGIEPTVSDPMAKSEEAKRLYGVELVDMDTIRDMDAVILAVAHRQFEGFTPEGMERFFAPGKKVLLDIKGLLDRDRYENAGYHYWRL